MPIVIRLDHVMLDKKMTLVELSKRVGITNVNLSKLKTGKVSAIRLSTLEAICDVLDCQPGDLLEFRRDVPAGEAAEDGDEGSEDGDRGRNMVSTLIIFIESALPPRPASRLRQRPCSLFLRQQNSSERGPGNQHKR